MTSLFQGSRSRSPLADVPRTGTKLRWVPNQPVETANHSGPLPSSSSYTASMRPTLSPSTSSATWPTQAATCVESCVIVMGLFLVCCGCRTTGRAEAGRSPRAPPQVSLPVPVGPMSSGTSVPAPVATRTHPNGENRATRGHRNTDSATRGGRRTASALEEEGLVVGAEQQLDLVAQDLGVRQVRV